jgi:signal transduction histidine kinase
MTVPAAADGVDERAFSTSRLLADQALESLPIGVLISSADDDRANAELHRIWHRPARLPFRRRTFWRNLELLARRDRGTPVAGAIAGSPIDLALEGESTPPTRYLLRRDDGTTAVVRIATAPIRNGDGIVGAVLVATDETAQHDTDRLRDAFLGILGHELRSPITAIVGGADLLGDDSLEPGVRAEVATTLVEEASRLHRLVDQLLQLARLERRDDVPREPVALAPAIRRLVLRYRSRLPRLTVDVAIEGRRQPVAADEGYTDQVLAILLDNAVKYAGSAGHIVIRVVHTRTEVEVHVLDEGPGLPDVGDAIFRLFHRGPTEHSEGSQGFGIGLFVARAIIDAMGGRIWAENRPDGGADVGFALPIAEA